MSSEHGLSESHSSSPGIALPSSARRHLATGEHLSLRGPRLPVAPVPPARARHVLHVGELGRVEGVGSARHDAARRVWLLHVARHRLRLIETVLDVDVAASPAAAVGGAVPPLQAVDAPAVDLLQHPHLSVGRVPDALKLVHRPPQVAHAKDAHQQPVCHEHVIAHRRARPRLARCRLGKGGRLCASHGAEEVGEEGGDAVVHVRARLPVGEPKEEAAEPGPLLEDGVHRLGVLEVAKVLFSQPRLRREEDRQLVKGAEQGEQRLARPHVRRVEEAHALVPDQVADLEPRDGGLGVPSIGERDLRVGHRREELFVRVAAALPVAHEDDPLRPIAPPVALIAALRPPPIDPPDQVEPRAAEQQRRWRAGGGPHVCGGW
mmetsp:Transcript_3007/g.10037  ORF Transcript_3007/g.10037 Transcript_3007/m.10037 type:complete len:377 (-) Transcript_3007:163-1293(-)